MKNSIPFLNLEPMHTSIKDEMQAAFERVYASNWFIMGPELEAFEQEYAQYSQTKYAVGVSNGLDALILALKALEVGPGDEVIIPSNTYIATALAVTHVGATPVLVEPRLDTYNINPDLIPAAINSKTKAIIPVHLYGQACEMEAVMEIAHAHDLKVVEDNAQAHGASFKGKLTGSWGHINATSFYPGKNLGALGDGGAVTTDDEELAERVKTLRNYGSKKKYYNEVIGHNNRLDELQAAFLRVKLKRLNDWTKERQTIAAWYTKELGKIHDLTTPVTHKEASHSYHLYVVRTRQRDLLQKQLQESGIGTMIHYPVPIHQQEAYSPYGLSGLSYPIAELLSDEVLSLPLWPGLNLADVQSITNQLAKI